MLVVEWAYRACLNGGGGGAGDQVRRSLDVVTYLGQDVIVGAVERQVRLVQVLLPA